MNFVFSPSTALKPNTAIVALVTNNKSEASLPKSSIFSKNLPELPIVTEGT